MDTEKEIAELRAEVDRLKRTVRANERWMLFFVAALYVMVVATNFFTNRSLDIIVTNMAFSTEIDSGLVDAVGSNTESLYFAHEVLARHEATIADMREQLDIMYDIIWNLNPPPENGE